MPQSLEFYVHDECSSDTSFSFNQRPTSSASAPPLYNYERRHPIHLVNYTECVNQVSVQPQVSQLHR